MQHGELSFSKDKWLHDTLNLSCCLILEKQKSLMTAHSRVSIWKYTTKGKSFINTGNVLLAWISFSTPSLFISQLNEQLTAHISSVPAASPVTLVSANCRQMRVSLPGEMGGGEGTELQGGDGRENISEENIAEFQLGLGGAFEPNAAAFLSFVHYVSLSVLNQANPSAFSKVAEHCVNS